MSTAFKGTFNLVLQGFEGRISLVKLISQFTASLCPLAYCLAKPSIPGTVQKSVQKSFRTPPVDPQAISVFLVYVAFEKLFGVLAIVRQVMR